MFLVGKKRLRRCGECSGCQAKDCMECSNCLDKVKYGGPGKKNNAVSKENVCKIPFKVEVIKLACKNLLHG